MTNPGPTKEEYGSLIYKLAPLEAELGHARKLLEPPAKRSLWRRLWGMGAEAAVVALAVVFVGVGCATLSNIQESPPLMVLDSPYSPEKVANCITDKGTQVGLDQPVWSVGWSPPTIKKSGDDYRILVVGVTANPLAEVSIKPSGSGSHIEVRATWWISRDQFLGVVERCAKKD